MKCRDRTVVNNLFKLSNLLNRFFIRIKQNKNNRIGSTKFSTKMKSQRIEKHIKKIAMKLTDIIKSNEAYKTRHIKRYYSAIKHTKLYIIKSNEADEFTVSTIANICTRLPQHH